eukprot:NODE_2793_length_1492_cov_58.192111_g2413_i0.p1 GENE.NODE_2793_length_1492_cov_58.192111_g2413_i0~~NODE_2793_length_1492_cov_58.192111_g2413_i0.p1  ORF type:complete len:455 (-),score=66.93 NODE_2793_length_1492_cov_58.192111_g2413_i0:127-1425(-)
MLYLCIYFLNSFGEGLLQPVYGAGMAQLTDDTNRELVFALAYSVANCGGGFGYMVTDWVRGRTYEIRGVMYSGLRFMLLTTLFAMLGVCILSMFIRDFKTINPQATVAQTDVYRNLRRSYIRDLRKLFTSRQLWQALICTSTLLFVSFQWRVMDNLYPKFAERYFGSDVAWGSIVSINLWSCVFFPPVVHFFLNKYSSIKVILLGAFIMSLSAVPLIFNISVNSSVLWICILSLGDVIWFPRSSSYVAALAIKGREGLFMWIKDMPTVIAALPATWLTGVLLEKYTPMCSECTDHLGFYCDTLIQINASNNCYSPLTGDICQVLNNTSTQCPINCHGCGDWVAYPLPLWTIVTIVSLISPLGMILLWKFLSTPAKPKPPMLELFPIPSRLDEEETEGNASLLMNDTSPCEGGPVPIENHTTSNCEIAIEYDV